MINSKINMKWAILFTLILSSFYLASQESLTFNGLKQIGDYSGLANYNYYTKGNDTIFNGNFEFGNVLAKENDAAKKPVIISGNFKNNQPVGEWKFQFGDFSKDGNKKLVDYQYVIKINGVQKSIFVNFENGKPHGKWIIKIDSLRNSEVTKTLFKSDFNYQNGVPQKSFRIETDTEFMVGRLLKNAVAHDVWSLYTKEGIGELESWYFDDGQLEDINIKIGEQTKQITLDYGKPTSSATINLDKHYLDIMELRLQLQDTSHVFDHGMSSLLKTDDENYGMVLQFFQDLDIALDVSGFKVNVPVFPLSEPQQNTLTQIEKSFRISDSIIQSILSDAQLSILKLNDSETEFLYKVAQTIDSEYLKPISKLITYKKEEVIQHITRKDLIKGLWPNGFPKEIVKTSDTLNQERIYVLNKSFYDFSKKDLTGVLELSRFILEISEKLEKELNKILSSNKREKAFVIQEKQLIGEANTLKKHVDSLNSGLPDDIGKTLESIKIFTDKTLANYSQMEENLEKLNYNKTLVECFKTSKTLATAVENLHARQKEIKKVYQDQVWNPFTATIMDEDIKKRITKAYQKLLIPYFLNDIQDNLSCDNQLNILNKLEKLHQRILDLKDEDTKRLERKLRRVEDPVNVLNLFGVSDE